MSTISISNLTYLHREELASLLSAPDAASKIAVIDVRDSDHVGGHIRSSHWVPINTFDYKLPELIRTLKQKDKVIFHCTLSQQRGPSAALRYAREKAKLRAKDPQAQEDQQEICVLEGGFSLWQAKYGEDENLTESYVKDIWAD